MPQAGFIAENDAGYEQITGLSAAKGFTTIPAGTVSVMVIPEAQAVRWRCDGTDPTAAVGMPLAVGQVLTLTAMQLARARFFEQAASAKLNVQYFK